MGKILQVEGQPEFLALFFQPRFFTHQVFHLSDDHGDPQPRRSTERRFSIYLSKNGLQAKEVLNFLQVAFQDSKVGYFATVSKKGTLIVSIQGGRRGPCGLQKNRQSASFSICRKLQGRKQENAPKTANNERSRRLKKSAAGFSPCIYPGKRQAPRAESGATVERGRCAKPLFL